ncbi:MAG TPA: hypothetical protein VFV68_16945 [Agriterribacter sp.]|nr:hypothetical protein [Agriterribacter sp.]
MDNAMLNGIITSVNHEKHYVSIEYIHKDRKRTITCRTDNLDQQKGKRPHQYRVGDAVGFATKGADRGSRIIAYNLQFLYNTAIEQMLHKAATDNRFKGYLKVVDDVFFVKEWDNYIFFPLVLSKWERLPPEKDFNEVIEFKLLHTDKPNKLAAELFSHDYIPEFRKAVQHFKNKTETEAVVSKVSPFGAYVDMFAGKIQSKVKLSAEELATLSPGDKIKVIITHLTNTRIVVEQGK